MIAGVFDWVLLAVSIVFALGLLVVWPSSTRGEDRCGRCDHRRDSHYERKRRLGFSYGYCKDADCTCGGFIR